LHEDISKRFSGENILPKTTSPNVVLQNMFVDTLLPTCQKSPVGYYGEYLEDSNDCILHLK
jgi:hypothetical protein